MSDEILGRILRRFLESDGYWSTQWWESGHGNLTLDGRLEDLSEEELVAVRKVGPDFWERHNGAERGGPR